MITYKTKDGKLSTGKPLADIRTAKESVADTKNHIFDDGKAIEGGFVVPIGFYNYVKFRCIEILDYLSAVAEYDAAALFGQEYWYDIQPREQRLIDACLQTLIADGDVPLEIADPSLAYPKYRLVLDHETLVTRFTKDSSTIH